VRRLAAGAATLPATLAIVLITPATAAAAALASGLLVSTTLTATLATLTTLLTTLLLTVTVALTRVIWIRASHSASNAMGTQSTLANCFSNVVSQPQQSHPSTGWKKD
jgi:hypothetical protein